MNLQISSLNTQYYEAETEADEATAALKLPITDYKTIITLKTQQLLTPKQKYFAAANATHDRDERLKTIKQDVKKQYLQAMLIQENIANTKSDIAIANRKLNEMNLRLKLGQIKQLDMKKYQDALNTFNIQLKNYNNQYNTSLRAIKNALDLKASDNIIFLSSNLSYTKFDDSKIEDRIALAVLNSYEVTKQNQSISLAQTQYDIYGTSDLNYSITSGTYTLDTVKQSVESKLWEAYYNLKTLEDNVEAENINQVNELNNLNLATLKNKLKLTTNADLMSEELTYNKQLTKTKSAINDYMLCIDSFKNMLGEK